MVRLDCPQCRLVFELDEAFRGNVCRCSGCGALVEVPESESGSARVVTVDEPTAKAKSAILRAARAAAAASPPPPPTSDDTAPSPLLLPLALGGVALALVAGVVLYVVFRAGAPAATPKPAAGPVPAPVAPATPVAPTLAAGLVAHWGFEGDTLDESGQGRHAQAAPRVDFVPGKVGRAISLTGKNHLVVPNHPAMQIEGDLTVSFWIKLPSKTKQRPWANIVANGDTSWRTGLDIKEPGQFHFAINDGRDHLNSTRKDYNDDQWHHVACVRRGKALEMHIDGKLEGSRPHGHDKIRRLNLELRIGSNAERPDRELVATLDEVRVHGRALTPAEIKDLWGIR